MQKEVVASTADVLVIVVPFIALMFAWMLRLDEIIATPKGVKKEAKTICQSDPNEQPGLCDPDGRRWPAEGIR